jgi:hypothetical protein
MTAPRWFVVVPCVLAIAACGDDDSGNSTTDASTSGDGSTAIDAPPTRPCDHTEQADATNHSANGAEATGITFGGALRLCGQIDSGHYDAVNEIVDFDVYRFTVAAETDVVMHVTGNGLGGLETVTLQIASTQRQISFGVFLGDHGALAARLPAGDYFAAVGAFHPSATSATIAYKLDITMDAPATRCGKLATAADYTESADGANHDGNDMIRYDTGADPAKSLTTSTTDAPEATGLVLAPGDKRRITGSSADVNRPDSYMDRDTYAIQTGVGTNQLTVRLSWQSTTVDFDYLMFYENTATSFHGGLRQAMVEDELGTFAVEPNQTYWLWVAAYNGSTNLPAAYDVTLCAESFTP